MKIYVFYTAKNNRIVAIDELDVAFLLYTKRPVLEKRYVILLEEL